MTSRHLAITMGDPAGIGPEIIVKACVGLKDRIAKLVISQVTPLMVMSPTNSLRGVLMQYLRPYLPMGGYTFRPEGPPTLVASGDPSP